MWRKNHAVHFHVTGHLSGQAWTSTICAPPLHLKIVIHWLSVSMIQIISFYERAKSNMQSVSRSWSKTRVTRCYHSLGQFKNSPTLVRFWYDMFDFDRFVAHATNIQINPSKWNKITEKKKFKQEGDFWIGLFVHVYMSWLILLAWVSMYVPTHAPRVRGEEGKRKEEEKTMSLTRNLSWPFSLKRRSMHDCLCRPFYKLSDRHIHGNWHHDMSAYMQKETNKQTNKQRRRWTLKPTWCRESCMHSSTLVCTGILENNECRLVWMSADKIRLQGLCGCSPRPG